MIGSPAAQPAVPGVGAPSAQPGPGLSPQAVLALGQAGRVWEFVPAAEGLFAAGAAGGPTSEPTLRLMLAASYGRLGLRTSALEHLDALDAITTGVNPAAASLRRAALALPADEWTLEQRIATAGANLAALRARGVRLGTLGVDTGPEGLPRAWLARAAAQQWFRTRDGQLLRRETATRRWMRFSDDAGLIRSIDLRGAGFVTTDLTSGPRPVYLDGADPPGLLLRLGSEIPPRSDGATPPIVLVQEDPLDLLDGLCGADVHALLADERLTLILGPRAGESLGTWLRDWTRDNLRCAPGTVLRTPGPAAAALPALLSVVEDAAQAQIEAGAAARARAEALYARRDRAWWAERYAAARAGQRGAARLRVLVPTTRYSTFIQHAASDLVAALGSAGADARLLIEPDRYSSAGADSVWHVLADWQPDLIVAINFPRSAKGESAPRNIPWLCWIQDAMPHLFDERVGREQGELDFVAGHLHEDLFARFGWPRARAVATPVTAAVRKFNREPVDAERARRFACDVAIATNHSQTPEAFADMWLHGPSDAPTKRLVTRLLPRVRAIAAGCATEPAGLALEQAVREAFAAEGLPEEPGAVARVHTQFARPLADRLIRHETIHWAAAICARRGWRLHLYGRGWSGHPTLAPFARGEALHGEDLRAAYREAGVHLHASINGNTHQRLAECALSGGLPLVRLKHDDLNTLMLWTQAAMCARKQCIASVAQPARLTGGRLVDGPETLRWAALQQRLGLPLTTGFSLLADPRQWDTPWMYLGGVPIPEDEAWLMGDLALTGFRDERELEVAIERALASAGYRESLSLGIAGRAARSQSVESLAPRLLGLIAQGLGAGGPTEGTSALDD
jgi:hypothetical protein